MLITVTWSPEPDVGPGDLDRVHLHIDGVHDHHDPELHRMEWTGEHWESTVDVPADLVSSYRIMPVTPELAAQVDAETDSRPRWMSLASATVPHVLDHPAWRPAFVTGERTPASGRLVMPDAPEEAGWDDADTPQWDAVDLDGRQLWTAGLTDSAEFLLVISDGVTWVHTALPAAVDRLHALGRLPRVAVVAVDTEKGRQELLTRSAEYRTLIADRVIPWAWGRIGRTPDPRSTVLAGESLGGLSALDVVLARPDAVAVALSNSGSFWFPRWDDGDAGGEVAEEIHARASSGTMPGGIRAHLSVGTGEGRPGVNGTTMVDHSTAVHAALVAAGVPATLEVGTHGHEMAGWAGALTRGLVRLLGDGENPGT